MKKIVLSSMLLIVMMISKAQNANNIIVDDTRDDNNLPAYYQRQAKFEFKRRDVLGLPGLGYSGLLTFAPWGDASGNKNHQLNFNDDGIFYRAGAHGDTWGNWSQLWHSANTPLPLHQWQNYIGNNVNASLDNMPVNTTVFSYESGIGGVKTAAPTSGAVVHLSGWGDSRYGMQLQTNYATGEFYIRTKNDDISKWTSWRRVLSEDANGNTGIGTISPENAEGWQRVLQVEGNLSSKIMASTNTTSAGLYAHDYGFYGAPAGGIIGTTTNHAFSVMTNKATRLTIAANGNVGINTTTPSEQLSVNGNIRSRKIIVTQTGWPDYVFDSSYQLPSLESVASFVQANKHLPDIPSAATIEKGGHDVGEVQKQLLKKVEELTLYVIDLKKENSEMKKENAALKKRVEKIEIK